MIWTVSERDHARGVVEFVSVTAGLAARTVRVTIGDGGDGTSASGIMYVITPVSDEGERVVAARYGRQELFGLARGGDLTQPLPEYR